MSKIIFELNITDSYTSSNMKDVEFRMWGGGEEMKCLRQLVSKDLLSQDMIKNHLREEIVILVDKELEKYIDIALKENGNECVE